MSLKKELDHMLKHYPNHYPKELFRDKDFYANWVAQTYFFVRHSTSLLGYAMPHLKNEGLRHHFEHHLSEEERHDLVALKDLEKLGRNISEFQELNQTQALYQSQYYRISFEGGTALLGYILFLEGLAVIWGREVYEDIKEVHKGASLFLKIHAEEDPHHLDAAIETILKLSVTEQEIIMRNLHYTHESYDSLISKISTMNSIRKAA